MKVYTDTSDSSGGGTSSPTLTQEEVEDYVGGLIQAGSNVTVDYNDTAGTLTISAAASGSSSTLELDGGDAPTGNTAAIGIEGGTA